MSACRSKHVARHILQHGLGASCTDSLFVCLSVCTAQHAGRQQLELSGSGGCSDSLLEGLSPDQHIEEHALQHGRQQVHGDAEN